jgi:beta-glucanase (GH16 family)
MLFEGTDARWLLQQRMDVTRRSLAGRAHIGVTFSAETPRGGSIIERAQLQHSAQRLPADGRPCSKILVALTLPASVALALAGSVAVSSRAVASSVPAAPTGWTTVWIDNFSGPAGSAPSSANWLYDTGTSYSGGAVNWGTGEVETDTSSTNNVYLDGNGHLVIKPIESGGSWTSARIETQRDDFEAPAGGEMEIAASIKQPDPAAGVGYWPAFWALGAAARPVGATNWPSIGEMDLMEDVNGLSKVSQTFHCGTDPGGPCNETTGLGSGLVACSGCETSYHTYSVIVDRTNTSDEQLRFYVDNNLRCSVSESRIGTSVWQTAVDHGFFIILDVVMGGSYPNAICNCTSPSSSTTLGAGMSVGYVAVYETGVSSGTTTTTAVASPRPVLVRLSSSAGPRKGGTHVMLTGSGFVKVSAVHFGTKKAKSFTVDSKTKIVAISPAGSGTVYVTVTTPGGTSVATKADEFRYR